MLIIFFLPQSLGPTYAISFIPYLCVFPPLPPLPSPPPLSLLIYGLLLPRLASDFLCNQVCEHGPLCILPPHLEWDCGLIPSWFYGVQGIKPRALCLLGKYSIN